MDQLITTSKRFFLVSILALFISLPGLSKNENLPARTAEMLGTLTNIDRNDTSLPEFESLIQEIFAGKKVQKQAKPLLVQFFKSEKSFAGKRFVLQELEKMGTPSAVQFMAELLTIDTSSELALMALQGIPGAKVNKILRKSIKKADPSILPGMINALGKRQDYRATSIISGYINDKNPLLATTAISALGKIGTPDATALLTRAMQSGNKQNQFIITEALLDRAEQLVKQNQTNRAFEIYNSIRAADVPEMIAIAAIKGKMETSSGNPADILKEELSTSPDHLKPGVIDLVKNLPASWKSGREFLQVPGLQDIDKSRLLVILAERNDKSIFDEVNQFIHHKEPVYRESAIYALTKIAELKDIPLLAELAATRSEKEQEIARGGFYRLPGKDVDAFILQKASGTQDIAEKTEYIKAIGERNIPSAAQVLIQTARNDNRDIRIESYRSLAKVAGKENLKELTELLLAAENSREKQELERTLYLVSTKEGQENAATEEIVAFLKNTPEKEKKSSLISVLGSIKKPGDINVLQHYLNSEDVDIQLSAIRALSEWPNAGPAENFKKMINNTDDLRVKTLALRGFTQVLVNDGSYPNGKKVNELLFGLENAPNVNEKKLVISALGKVSSSESLKALVDHLKNPGDLRPELEAAILNMVPQLMRENKNNTTTELKRVKPYTSNAEILKWLNN
ncbi:MAG: HEAT repeat domain-containing protein [Mariniphaga sp.]